MYMKNTQMYMKLLKSQYKSLQGIYKNLQELVNTQTLVTKVNCMVFLQYVSNFE